SPPSWGWQGDLLQEFEFIENSSDSQGHTGHRVLGDRHGKLSLSLEQLVQPPKKTTAAGEDNAGIDDVRGQFWRGLLETGAHGLDNRHHGVAKRLADFALCEDKGLRKAIQEIPALHFHAALVTLPRVDRPERHLDLFGSPLANQKVVLSAHVLQNRVVHLVARDPHRLAVDDPGE